MFSCERKTKIVRAIRLPNCVSPLGRGFWAIHNTHHRIVKTQTKNKTIEHSPGKLSYFDIFIIRSLAYSKMVHCTINLDNSRAVFFAGETLKGIFRRKLLQRSWSILLKRAHCWYRFKTGSIELFLDKPTKARGEFLKVGPAETSLWMKLIK